MKLQEAALTAQANSLHPLDQGANDLLLTGVAMDSRTVKPGDLFVCIKGEHTDGHLHADQAVRAGAVAVLAEHDPFAGGSAPVPVLLVDSSVRALGRLGHAWRRKFTGKVVGVTGTAGKTTVKELLANILAVRGPTARNPLNFNTQIGLPMSILATTGKEEFWVMEAGISQAEDMDELGPVLEPDLALILNVGAGHTQWLGGKGTAHYKALLLKYLAPGGTVLVSADYPDLVKEARVHCPTSIFFSITGKQIPYRASYLGLSEDGRGHYHLWLDGLSLDVVCALSGSYSAENVMAAAAAAHLLGLSMKEIARGLETATLPAQRFNRFQVPGWVVIDDSYNANPLSCARVLEAVCELGRDKIKVCVMGEMLELGDIAEAEHEALGRALASSGAQAVFWFGGFAAKVRQGLEKEHYSGYFRSLTSPDEFLPALTAWEETKKGGKEGLILFKGSRGNKLERLVEAFTKRQNARCLNGGDYAV